MVNKIDDPTLEWQDLIELRQECIGENEHKDTLRKGAKLFYEYLKAGWIKNPEEAEITTNDSKLRELKKERFKIQSEKLELNKWLREAARDELITEKICQAIENLPPIYCPDKIEKKPAHREYLCCFGDCHYGIEFDLKDLTGNTINKYSPEIFEQRMWELYYEIVSTVSKEEINEINIWDLGDDLQGILRLNSQLLKLRWGIIDSGIYYANFLAHWLNEISKHVRIKFQMVIDSNHNQLRICNAPKNAFPEENMSKVILQIIKIRLADNSNIEIVENPTGMNYANLCGFNILGIHGEEKDLGDSIFKFSKNYGQMIDYIIGAHKHHLIQSEVGKHSEALHIRGIVGGDPHGLSLNKVSDAGASLFVFEKNKGLVCDNRIILN